MQKWLQQIEHSNYQSESRTLLGIPTDSLTHNDMRQLYYSHSKTSSLIGRVARYTSSSTYVLRLDILQNLFDKPNEQGQAYQDSAMARKGGRWPQYAAT